MVAQASEIEPLISRTRVRYTRPRLLPFGHPPALEQISVIHAAHDAAGFRRARLVLVINRPRWGGGRRLEGNLAHALAPRISPEDVVVVYTDGTGATAEGRFPDGVREIDFVGLASHLDPEDAASRPGRAASHVLRRRDRQHQLRRRSTAPCESLRTGAGRRRSGSSCASSATSRPPRGSWAGWSLRYFYRLFDHVAGVITDSDYLAQRAARRPIECRTRSSIGFTSCAHRSIPRCPVWPSRPRAQTGGPRSSGRAAGTGRSGPALLLAVARRMPDVDFRMWGESVMDRRHGRTPTERHSRGPYAHISEIPLGEADVWLYTSGWDGVPSQLLEVAMTGIPIVGTLVGGTGEVLSEDDAWPCRRGRRRRGVRRRDPRGRWPTRQRPGVALGRCATGCCGSAPRRRSPTRPQTCC